MLPSSALLNGVLLLASIWLPLRLLHDVGNAVARYNADGTPDTSFNSSGLVAVDAPQQMYANALAIQSDGRIVVAGAASDVNTGSVGLGLARYEASGVFDAGFGVGGTVKTGVGDRDAEGRALALQSDGKILVAGTAFGRGGTNDHFGLARFNPDGTLDASFGIGGGVSTQVGAGSAEGRGIALQADGKVVVVGTAFFNGPTDDDFAVARYASDGTLDSSFGGTGVVTTDFGPLQPGPGATLDRANAVALQSDGKLVVVGSTGRLTTDFALARYNEDGTLDPSFGSGGRALGGIGNGAEALAVALQPDGRIVAAGSGAPPSGSSEGTFVVARYSADGAPDRSFGASGFVVTFFEGGGSGARAVVVAPDGSILVGGSGYGPGTTGDVPVGGLALVRYQPDGTPDPRFGIGGRTLTTAGDAGGAVNALGLWPDGRIVAAGLATFKTTQTR